MSGRLRTLLGVALALLCLPSAGGWSQAVDDETPAFTSSGILSVGSEEVPRDVREMTDRGLQYLMKSQSDAGDWPEQQAGPGTTGLALLAFLASGEDPNFGIYSSAIRKALRSIIRTQSETTGYMGNSMYHHGFAMLALAEAYGAVDETELWSEPADDRARQRSVGEALELAVRCAVTSQEKNPFGAWRYAPSARDADTSVSGAVLVGLLAARNAGIEVPDKSIDQAIKYYVSMTGNNGIVGYSGGMEGFGESTARSSIACLVFCIAKRKDVKPFEAVRNFLAKDLKQTSHYQEYARYYQAQALFQADLEAWEKWNRSLIRELRTAQNPDGSFQGQFGPSISTSLALLALALNYKFLPIYER